MDKIMTIKNKVHINEWSEMVAICRNSWLTAQQWCINIKTYYYRLRMVRGVICEETHDIVQIPLNTSNSDAVASSIKINMGNLNIELPELLQQLVIKYRAV